VDFEGTSLPEQQQAERVVELGVGEQHRLERRRAALPRAQGGERLDLGVDVG
jgi:hypothetical protein